MGMKALMDLRPELDVEENLSLIPLTRKSSAKLSRKIAKASARQERHGRMQ